VAREIQVNEGTLGNWVHKYRVERSYSGLSRLERIEPGRGGGRVGLIAVQGR